MRPRTFGGVHAPHGEQRPHGGLAGAGAGALEQRPPLGQQVVLHGLHHQALALHTLPQEGVRLHVRQELRRKGAKAFNVAAAFALLNCAM